jgi:ATP-dependent DNA ligase
MPPSSLERFKGFVAQYKYDDIRTLFHFHRGGEISLLSRKLEPVKEYRLTSRMARAFQSLELDPSQIHVLDGGVMRHLRVHGQNPIVVWDILVHNGQYLLGTTYAERYQLLRELAGEPAEFESATGRKIGLTISNELWLAPIFTGNFRELFEKVSDLSPVEGLLLKNAHARLESGFKEVNNSRWQIKIRKPKKHYMY